MSVCGIKGILHECGEFHQDGGLSRATRTDSKLKLLYDFFNANNSRISEVYSFLEHITNDKIKKSTSAKNVLKFVVRTHLK